MVNMTVSWLQLLDFTLGDERTPPTRPEVYPQNLSQISIPCIYLFVRGSKKREKGRGGSIQISQKEKPF